MARRSTRLNKDEDSLVKEKDPIVKEVSLKKKKSATDVGISPKHPQGNNDVSTSAPVTETKNTPVKNEFNSATSNSGPSLGNDHDPLKKKKAIIVRAIFGFGMIFGFIAVMIAGPLYMILLVSLLQFLVFKELAGLFDLVIPPEYTTDMDGKSVELTPEEKRNAERVRRRWRRRVTWSFYFAVNYALYGFQLISFKRRHVVLPFSSFFDSKAMTFLLRNHLLISFMIYMICFVVFVARLKRAQLRDQFGLFAWVHTILLLIVGTSHLLIENIMTAIIWFWLPVSLVVMNDVAAYVCGMLFGRTQLIKLSPKKTVEGFVGALLVTCIFGIIWGSLFSLSDYMVCPVTDLTVSAFTPSKNCPLDPIFYWNQFVLPDKVITLLQSILPASLVPYSIPYSDFQFHCFIMSIFASLVAPFGGFFASGFKRAFQIKDFGNSIPGHGGLTDRFDCQFIMGAFVFAYQNSVTLSVQSIPDILYVISTLSRDTQIELYHALGQQLHLHP